MKHIKEVLDKIVKDLYIHKGVMSSNYKPEGESFNFRKEMLDQCMLQNRPVTLDELKCKALRYCMNSKENINYEK